MEGPIAPHTPPFFTGPRASRAALALLFLVIPLVSCNSSSEPPQNLVLIVIDALRPDHTGAYGYPRPTTPNLDRFAEDSILFETAIASAAFTLPSMATLFTSLDPVEHGVRRHLDYEGSEDTLGGEMHTLAEVLKEQGYATGAVVSNALFLLENGFDQGFDHFDPGRRRDAEPTTEAALAWLRERPADQPFFLWVHYIDPHWPYDAPRGAERPFTHPDRGQFQRTVRAFEEGRIRSDEIYFENTLDRDGVLRGVAEYDNEIAYADRHMGRLLDSLKKSDLYDRSVIAVVSDHGEALGEHGLHFAHSFHLYDEIQKVVFLLKPRGGGKPVKVEEPVRLLDFMPTVLSLLDLEDRSRREGVDLRPLWEGSSHGSALPELFAYAESEPRYRNRQGNFRYPSRKRAYLEGNQGKWRMVRSNRYKLILIPGEGQELYDLAADPLELRKIADRELQAAGALGRRLEEMMEKEIQGLGKKTKRRPEEEKEALRLIKEMGY